MKYDAQKKDLPEENHLTEREIRSYHNEHYYGMTKECFNLCVLQGSITFNQLIFYDLVFLLTGTHLHYKIFKMFIYTLFDMVCEFH